MTHDETKEVPDHDDTCYCCGESGSDACDIYGAYHAACRDAWRVEYAEWLDTARYHAGADADFDAWLDSRDSGMSPVPAG